MRIGLDIDGVLFDYVDNTRQIAKALWPARSADFDRPATCWNYFAEDWGLTSDEFHTLNRLGMARGMLFKGPVVDGWLGVLHELREDNHSIHLVTHRSMPGAITETDQWLRHRKVPYDSITFVHDTGDKSYTDLDVLIDDKPENIADWVATGRPAIIYHQAWNAKHPIDSDHVLRAGGPQHVLSIVRLIAVGRTRRSTAMSQAQWTTTPEEPLVASESILEEAQRLVHGDRGEDYGHPIEDFTRTGRIWGAVLGLDRDVTPNEVALCMVGVKMSREVNKPKRDNRVDGAGYFATLDMVRERQEQGAAS